MTANQLQNELTSVGQSGSRGGVTSLATVQLASTQRPNEARASYLQIEGLSKKYGDFLAVDDVSFTVRTGELVCLLGPSGCGKTTLLRMIAGLEAQTAGRILQETADISDLPPRRRNFGIVFQSYALFPNLSVADNVAYGLVARGTPKKDISVRVDELLALVGLTTEARKFPAQLSGGQQQRVALIRALATSPGLLLLDEPLSALDAQVRQHLRDEIRNLQKCLGITTIMVTHDQDEALALADRVIVMNEGRIEQIGTPTEIYDQPQSEFVAGFVGVSSVFEGVVNADNSISVGGLKLFVNAMQAATPSSRVTISVRPEDIIVGDTAQHLPNHFRAKIWRVTYKGAQWRATLLLGEDVSTKLQADLSASSARDLGLQEGETITVAIPPNKLRIFARSAVADKR